MRGSVDLALGAEGREDVLVEEVVLVVYKLVFFVAKYRLD